MVKSKSGVGQFMALAAGLGINYDTNFEIKDISSNCFPKRKLRKHFGILTPNVVNIVKNKNQKCLGCGHKNKKCTCKKG